MGSTTGTPSPAAAEDGAVRDFLALSAALTGFTTDELRAAGTAHAYLAVVREQAGAVPYGRLVDAADPLEAGEGEDAEAARALIHLWYTGSWPGLPGGGGAFTVSPEAYAAGLVWRAVGVSAPGTRPRGFRSWAEPVPAVAPEPAAAPVAAPRSPATAQTTAGPDAVDARAGSTR
ncbi:hypothetical protein [Streptomyces xanthophaeus]|uniref:hypothetical protein n=1 Tax=Streptomyces xanthophaeus TaxID=67385 RepID=UPI00364A86E8